MFSMTGVREPERNTSISSHQALETRLATLEFMWFDHDGGTAGIENELREGNDILAGWRQEVQDRYGHLWR